MLQLTSQDLPRIKADTLIIPVCEDRVLYRSASLSG